jgi:hypothetical protein
LQLRCRRHWVCTRIPRRKPSDTWGFGSVRKSITETLDSEVEASKSRTLSVEPCPPFRQCPGDNGAQRAHGFGARLDPASVTDASRKKRDKRGSSIEEAGKAVSTPDPVRRRLCAAGAAALWIGGRRRVPPPGGHCGGRLSSPITTSGDVSSIRLGFAKPGSELSRALRTARHRARRRFAGTRSCDPFWRGRCRHRQWSAGARQSGGVEDPRPK